MGLSPSGNGEISAPRFTLVGRLEGDGLGGRRGSPSHWLWPGCPSWVPLESSPGCWRQDSAFLTSWLPSVVCTLFPVPPSPPFVTVQRSEWALGRRGCLCAGAGTPLGGAAWRVPQSGAAVGGLGWHPPVTPPPPSDRHRRRDFSQKVIQQALHRILNLLTRTSIYGASLFSPGSVSHPSTSKSL